MKPTVRIVFLTLVGVVLASVLLHSAILGALGSYLVSAGPPQKADLAFVLAGDFNGPRIFQAAALARQGYVPKVVVSGPAGDYGYYECDLAIPFAEKAGYPASYFLHFENHALSTAEEAQAAAGELRRLGAKRVLLVTSDYHTRRAGKIFRAAAPEITFYVVAAPDFYFTADGWWRNREGRKTFATEWMKTVAEWFGI